MSKIKTVEDLIERAGGSPYIGILLNLHQYTVERWQISGHIPQKYWKQLMAAYKVSKEELENLTLKKKG